MGDSQSTTIHYYIQTIKNYTLPPSKRDQLPPLSHLLQSTEHERVNDRQVNLKIMGQDSYRIKSQEDIVDLLTHYGCVEILKVEGDKERRLFEGVIKKGERNGFGESYAENQTIIYRGQFDHDVYEGWGCTPNYRGQFKKGKRHGWGVYTDQANRIYYEGYFLEDLFHGIGYVNVTQNQLKAFLQQNIMLSNPNFDIQYVGEWKYGKMSGRGKLVTVSQIYTGDFVEGLFQGQGKLTSASSKIEGKFYQGQQI